MEISPADRGSEHSILLFLVTSLITPARSICPISCVCYLNETPRTISCANHKLDQFPERISELVEHLNLSGNNLNIIPSDVGRLSELKQMILSNNKLDNLPDALENLIKLEKFDLSDNYISDINRSVGVISRLSNLKFLYLRNNPITSLDSLKSPTLRVLDLSRCMISHLSNETLLGFPQLITLNLNGNPLKSIDHMRSQKLKWLDLSNCMLNYLYPEIFQGIPELEQLRMANNPTLVYSSRTETLRHNKLKRLDVSACNLDRPGIHGLPGLTHVILTRNIIRLLPDGIFSKNKMLMHLSLNGNGLTEINHNSFDGIPRLEVLDLSSNNLETLPWMMLKDNINLRLLNLSFNDIKELPLNFTTTAMIVDLSYNLIEYISKDSLMNMPRIKSLDLSKNRLETFSSGIESLSLKTLILEDNRLTRLSNQSFSYLPSLTGIDLSGNRLTEGIDYEIFKNNQELHAIRLHDNPWRCDCQQLYPIYYYITRSSKTNPSTLICESPSNVSGYSWSTACRAVWGSNRKEVLKSDRTYGLVVMGFLIAILVFGSIVSIGHTIKEKRRQALLRIREAERTEARERLLLHRRNQLEESRRQENIPRIHPDELIGPPTYEEAVQMPRLVRSLDNLDSISIEALGQSAQSLDRDAWVRKRRRQQRKKAVNRTRSEDHLERRCEDGNQSTGRTTKKSRSSSGSRGRIACNISSKSTGKRFSIIKKASESEEPTSSADGSWTRTLRSRQSNTKQKRRNITRDEHSSDDEDSDVLKNQSTSSSRRNISIAKIEVLELPREPRSGTYRPPVSPTTSLVFPVPSPEQCEVNGEYSRSQIV